ncbi:MAG TPA: glycine cleavage system protein GcvH [Deltaproteobacteria bacterium]|nr:glycine cleavage system protein H [Deltaproteobacteria bacterium]HCP44614.1 glycine cleavage system protein GcvH [Deltaproteobacteria bacterium]|tara:strand:+ start:802 stop:1185 length:384 start_codon:yes stop_codon:yes gene_type:complete
MASIPQDLKYSEDHEWVLVDGGVATIGITHHAQDQLGDVVYLGDFPDTGSSIEQGDPVGVVESVKATSDIYAPISGSIVEINADLIESPELVNSDPYGEGWIVRMKIQDTEELNDLLSHEAYEELLD